jgi:hypothetical protein
MEATSSLSQIDFHGDDSGATRKVSYNPLQDLRVGQSPGI